MRQQGEVGRAHEPAIKLADEGSFSTNRFRHHRRGRHFLKCQSAKIFLPGGRFRIRASLRQQGLRHGLRAIARTAARRSIAARSREVAADLREQGGIIGFGPRAVSRDDASHRRSLLRSLVMCRRAPVSTGVQLFSHCVLENYQPHKGSRDDRCRLLHI